MNKFIKDKEVIRKKEEVRKNNPIGSTGYVTNYLLLSFSFSLLFIMLVVLNYMLSVKK